MKDEQEDWVHRLYRHAAEQIILSTPKLYIWSDARPAHLVPHGSAILVKVESDHYLLTAAHCLSQSGRMIHVCVIDETGLPRKINGAVAFERGHSDSIDVAAVKLSDQSVKLLSQPYRFIEGGHQITLNGKIEDQTDYLIVGHPNTGTRIDNKKKKIQHSPLVHLSKSASPEVYSRLNVNHSESLLLGYNQRKSTFLEQKAMNMAPDPKGISGGGIWFIPEYNVSAVENVEYLLCGILIEHYNIQNLIKATKIEKVIPLIRGLRHKSAD